MQDGRRGFFFNLPNRSVLLGGDMPVVSPKF
jgi:hypothetical protein